MRNEQNNFQVICNAVIPIFENVKGEGKLRIVYWNYGFTFFKKLLIDLYSLNVTYFFVGIALH